jgi:CarboxypepD_reg-like domain
MISKHLAIIFLLLIPCILNAQEGKYKISGKIIDEKSKQPIENAEVFISGGTNGTITNNDGEFTLEIQFIPCHLVAMHISFQPMVLVVTTEGKYNIELSNALHNIKEVSVTAENIRRKNLRLFYKYFMYYANKQQIKILNDSVLHFIRDENDLHAYCNTPLIIENKYLGYTIKVLIQDFHICKKLISTAQKVKLNSASGIGVFKLNGYYYFQEVNSKNPRKNEQIILNRKSQYYGSLRHFLTCLYENELETNGYILNSNMSSVEPLFQNTSQRKEIKHYQFLSDTIFVTYYHKQNFEPINIPRFIEAHNVFIVESNRTRYSSDMVYSTYFECESIELIDPLEILNKMHSVSTTLLSQGKEFEVRSNGTSQKLSFELQGAMSKHSLVNSLPSDYIPETQTE